MSVAVDPIAPSNTNPNTTITGNAPVAQRKRSKVNTVALIIIAAVVALAAITYAGPVLKPVLVAVFIFYTVRPAANFLMRRGLPAWLAYTLVLLVCVAVLVGLGHLVQQTAFDFQKRWPEHREKLVRLIDDMVPGIGPTVADQLTMPADEAVRFAFGTALGVLEFTLMAFFYLVFIILDSGKIARRVRRALTPERSEHVVAVAAKIADQLGYYMRVKTVVSVGMALTAAAVLAPFGIEYWLLWAFLFFVLNYITYIGSIVACVPPVAAALLQFENPWVAVAVLGLVGLTRFIWIDLIEIRFSGKQLNVDSSLLLAFLAYWGWTWGVVGLLLAVPMLTSLKIILANVSDTWPLARLMSDE